MADYSDTRAHLETARDQLGDAYRLVGDINLRPGATPREIRNQIHLVINALQDAQDEIVKADKAAQAAHKLEVVE